MFYKKNIAKFSFVNILLFFFFFNISAQNTEKEIFASLDTIKQDFKKIYFLIYKADKISSRNLELAGKLMDKAKLLTDTLGDDTIAANVYNTYGIIQQRSGNYKNALDYYYISYSKYEQIHNKAGMAYVENNLGIVNFYLGNYDKSLEHYLNAIRLSKEEGSPIAASFYNNIGIILDERQRYNDALNYYRLSLEAAQKDKDSSGIATAFNNMAEVYNHQGKYDSAKIYYSKALKINDKLNDLQGEALVYLNFGDLALKQKKYKLAHKNLDISEKLYRQIGDTISLAYLYEVRAKTFLEQRKINKALKIALLGYDYSVKSEVIDLQKRFAQIISKIYKEKNKYKKSLEYFKKYKALSDSIKQISVDNQLANYEAQIKFEAEKRKIELENSKQRAKQQALILQEKQRRNIILLVVLVLAIIVFFTLKSNFMQKKHNRMLTEKNQQINEHSEELLQTLQQLSVREQQLSELNATKDKLFSIIGHDLRGPVGSLQSLMQLLVDQYDMFSADDIKNMLSTAKESSEQTFSLLENLLMWAKTQKEEVIYESKYQDLKPIVDNNIRLLCGTAEIKSINVIPRFESCFAYFDTNTVSTIIRNLLSNALKFTKENGVIEIFCTELKDEVKITVQDTGIGMDKEMINKLLDPSQIVTTYGTNNEKGSGLGIKLCIDLVHKNNGKFTIQSEKGVGSKFSFTLPKQQK